MNELGLFAGIGGMSLGLEWAGFETVAFCEIDKKCQLVLKKHWPNVPIYGDIEELTFEKLKKDGITEIDIITGGFPCQDISNAGKRAGITASRSGLWKEMSRIISEVLPKYVIVENVTALRGRGLSVVLGDLAEIGYDAEWHCIPASAIGAPHQRDRIWIIAYPRPVPGEIQPRIPCQTPSEELAGLCESKLVSYTDSQRKSQSKRTKQAFRGRISDSSQTDVPNATGKQSGGQKQQKFFSDIRTINQFITNPDSARCFQQRRRFSAQEELTALKCGSQWEIEPDVGRVVDGFPGRVDRLKQLGNAVVPQIPYLIGMAIMEVEKERAA